MKHCAETPQDNRFSEWFALALDPDGNAIELPQLPGMTVLRIRTRVSGQPIGRKAFMQTMLAQMEETVLPSLSQGREEDTPSGTTSDPDIHLLIIDVAPDGSIIVATHPEWEVESNRRLRIWLDKTSAASTARALDVGWSHILASRPIADMAFVPEDGDL